MPSSQLADRGLDLGRGLVGAGGWAVGAVGERGQAASLVAGAVNGLARDAEALGDVDDLPAVLDHREHRLICPRLAGQMG